MKKQLLIVALTLGFVATTECHKNKTTTVSVQPGSSAVVTSKTQPSGSGITATRIGKKKKKQWQITNTGTTPVTVTVRRK